jgi:hypothetical protein
MGLMTTSKLTLRDPIGGRNRDPKLYALRWELAVDELQSGSWILFSTVYDSDFDNDFIVLALF